MYIGLYSASFLVLCVQTPPRRLSPILLYLHRNCTLARPVLSLALGPTLPFRFIPESFPSFVHKRVHRSFCCFRACFVLGPTLPPRLLPDWVPSYVHRPVQCKLPCALGPNPRRLNPDWVASFYIYIGIVRWPYHNTAGL